MPHKRLSLVEVTENVDVEESYTEEQQFDPLLECLEAVAHHYDRTVPRAALLAGLPLADGLLTPRLAASSSKRKSSGTTRISGPPKIWAFPYLLRW